jgi:hypothetical protein
MENIMDVVKTASLISPEDLQKHREEASRLFALNQERLSEEMRRLEVERDIKLSLDLANNGL